MDAGVTRALAGEREVGGPFAAALGACCGFAFVFAFAGFCAFGRAALAGALLFGFALAGALLVGFGFTPAGALLFGFTLTGALLFGAGLAAGFAFAGRPRFFGAATLGSARGATG
jgi:hypothetical protein